MKTIIHALHDMLNTLTKEPVNPLKTRVEKLSKEYHIDLEERIREIVKEEIDKAKLEK